MSVTSSRRLALQVLSRVRRDGAWTRDALDAALRATPLERRDAGFATRLAYGTVSMLGSLDFAIDRYTDRPSSIEPAVRDALRVSAYEILFMSTEDRAAVHQGVELVRSVRPRASGLANAVLRRLVTDASAFPWGDPAQDVAVLALETGHPLWLTQRLIADLGGARARRMLHADSTEAPLYLALNPFRSTADELSVALEKDGTGSTPCGIPGCLKVSDSSAAVTGDALASGAAVVADAATQTVVSLAPTRDIHDVVDVASGRGTKSFLLQAAAARAGVLFDVIALDLHRFKTDLLDRRMASLEVPQVRVEAADATDASALAAAVPQGADLVFVDAPCSGLGTLRRHPEKRWTTSPDDITTLALLGRSILEASSHLVRPGGFMVYSTCTVLPEENGEVVSGFLASEQGRGFATVPVVGPLAGSFEDAITTEGWFQSIPEPDGPDGHFAAILRRD